MTAALPAHTGLPPADLLAIAQAAAPATITDAALLRVAASSAVWASGPRTVSSESIRYLDGRREGRVEPGRPDDSANTVTLVLLAVSGPIDDSLLRELTQTRVVASAGRSSSPAVPEPVIEPARYDADRVLTVGHLRMDLERVQVTLDGREIDLTHQEFLLLKAFMDNPGRVLSRTQLLEQAWEYGAWGAGRTVDVHVRRLRVKLGPDLPWIVTVRGFGYRLEALLTAP